jgi:hypothetical protein
MKSLDILIDVVSKYLAASLNFRAHPHTQKSAPSAVLEERNGRNADHAKKDTSRQNRTPQSGQGRER